MRPGPEGQSVGAEFRVTSVKSPILSMEKLVKQGFRFEAGSTGCKMSKGDSTLTLGAMKNCLWVDVRAYTTAEEARSTDARRVALVVSELLVEPPSSSSPTTPSFQTARAPQGSAAEHLDSSSPVEDIRTRLRELRAPVWGTKTKMWSRVLEREATERRHLDEQALLDRRRRDLERAIDPTEPKTMKGPDVPTESERTAHEITHLPPAPWCETCILGRGIEAPHVRLRWNATRGPSSL